MEWIVGCRTLLASGGGVSRTGALSRRSGAARPDLVPHSALIWERAVKSFSSVFGMHKAESTNQLVTSNSINVRFFTNSGQRCSSVRNCSQNYVSSGSHVVQRRVVRHNASDVARRGRALTKMCLKCPLSCSPGCKDLMYSRKSTAVMSPKDLRLNSSSIISSLDRSKCLRRDSLHLV